MLGNTLKKSDGWLLGDTLGEVLGITLLELLGDPLERSDGEMLLEVLGSEL